MSKFKVGDKVKLTFLYETDRRDGLTTNNTYTICDINYEDQWCKLKGYSTGVFFGQLSLAEEFDEEAFRASSSEEEFQVPVSPELEKAITESLTTKKDSNPKDAIGSKKSPLSVIPGPVLYEIGLGLLEGAAKYGSHNYRVVGVRSSVYVDATMRHIWRYWEGQDIDPDSGIHHVTKAISSLVVLRDAMIQGKCFDDRPPATEGDWMVEMNEKAKSLIEALGDKIEPFLEVKRSEWRERYAKK